MEYNGLIQDTITVRPYGFLQKKLLRKLSDNLLLQNLPYTARQPDSIY